MGDKTIKFFLFVNLHGYEKKERKEKKTSN